MDVRYDLLANGIRQINHDIMLKTQKLYDFISVIHTSDGVTTAIFKDGVVVRVRCSENDSPDDEKGFAMVILKSYLSPKTYSALCKNASRETVIALAKLAIGIEMYDKIKLEFWRNHNERR